MPFQVVFLNLLTGAPAVPADRLQNCIGASGLQVGGLANLMVRVQNIGTDNCNQCTVEFFFKKSSDPAPVSITHAVPSNPLPPLPLLPGGSTAFVLDWAVQPGDLGAGFVYAQIQTPNRTPHPEDMSRDWNAREPVQIVSVISLANPR